MVSTWSQIDNKLQLPQGQQSELCIANYSLFFKMSQNEPPQHVPKQFQTSQRTIYSVFIHRMGIHFQLCVNCLVQNSLARLECNVQEKYLKGRRFNWHDVAVFLLKVPFKYSMQMDIRSRE